jgi:carbon monoxide dehydrogenase subunit G
MELTNEFDVSVPVDQAWAVLTDVERIAPCLPGAQLQEVEGDEYRGIVKVKVGPITAQYKGKASFVELDHDAHRAVLHATGRDTRGQGNASAAIVAELTASEGGTHVSVTTDLTVTGKVAQFGRGVLADVSAKLLGQFVDNLETTVLVDVEGSDEAAVLAEAEAVVQAAAEEAAADGAGIVDQQGAALGQANDIGAGLDTGVSAAEQAGIVDQQDAALVASGQPDAGTTDPEQVAADEAVAGIVDQQAAVAAEVRGADGPDAPQPPEGSTVRRIESPEPEAIDLLGHAGSPVLKRLAPLLGLTLAVLVGWRLVRRRR